MDRVGQDRIVRLLLPAILVALVPSTAQAQQVFSAYSSFDADKTCKHTKGRVEEDYGSWVCPGHAGLIVRLSAGDQRMQVSFGRNGRAAAKEEAASQTFPGFNSVYRGIVEWRMEKMRNGKTRPFATILRWHTRTAEDAERDDGKSTGQTLVITRLNPGGVCHVGYIDARSPDANEAARRLADEKARSFKCGVDDPRK
jgi:hypothetical protein